MLVESKVEELASRFQETHRNPDPYRFLIDADGDLFSPSHSCKVISTINTDHMVGQLEKAAFVAVSQWVREESRGAIVWVSPPYPGLYPVSKVIISEIEYIDGVKRLFNRAIVLDINEKECLQLGRQLTQYSEDQPFLVNSEDLRATPIVLDTTDYTWLSILKNIGVDTGQIEAVETGQDIISKKTALAQAEMIFSMDERERPVEISKRMGDKPESCPPGSASGKTAFQIFSENSLTYTGSVIKDPDFCKSCPVCGKEINTVVRSGQSCPKCGAKKECG